MKPATIIVDLSAPFGSFPGMLKQGVWAEIKVGNEHLRLFSEHNALGVQASVYNVNARNWTAPSEPVDDIETVKDRAEAHARAYLQSVGHSDLPPLEWKKPVRYEFTGQRNGS